MPMIDVYASEATFAHPHDLARDLAAAVMRWEQVPDILLFRKNAGVRGPRGIPPSAQQSSRAAPALAVMADTLEAVGVPAAVAGLVVERV